MELDVQSQQLCKTEQYECEKKVLRGVFDLHNIINQLGGPEISPLGLHRGEGDVLEYLTEDIARFYPLPRAI